jgi:hypothetical protein
MSKKYVDLLTEEEVDTVRSCGIIRNVECKYASWEVSIYGSS